MFRCLRGIIACVLWGEYVFGAVGEWSGIPSWASREVYFRYHPKPVSQAVGQPDAVYHGILAIAAFIMKGGLNVIAGGFARGTALLWRPVVKPNMPLTKPTDMKYSIFHEMSHQLSNIQL